MHANERGDDNVLQSYFRQDPLPGAVRLHGASEAQRETQGHVSCRPPDGFVR